MIVLIGFMGAGKTTIGYLLAEKLGLPFVDVDILIERREKTPVSDIFRLRGENIFRTIEHETIVEILAGPDAVVALGGGAVEHPGTRLALETAMVVYLEVVYDEAVLRIGHDSYRPMMTNPSIRDIYNRRLPFYGSVAKLTIRTGGRRPEAIVMDIISTVVTPSEVPSGTRSVLVAPMGGAHQVHIGPGISRHVTALIPNLAIVKKAFLVHSVADVNLSGAIAKSLSSKGVSVSDIVVPQGEEAKRFAIAESVCEQLSNAAAHRDDLIVAIGGDPVCYLSGFVASTFSRGMRLILVPTTLFSQVDSAIGGKNGLSLTGGENMVGTIYQPLTVISDQDLDVLRSDVEFSTGLAEMIKHALIGDEEFLEVLFSSSDAVEKGSPQVLEDLIYRSTRIKAAIVTADEREQGERLYLNYGHTFGHAFEQILPSGPDRHGDAVSLGMMAAAYLSFRQGRITQKLVDLHRNILEKYRLPVSADLSLPALDEVWHRNKKFRSGVRFIVLNGIGQPEGGVVADRALLSAVMDDLRSG